MYKNILGNELNGTISGDRNNFRGSKLASEKAEIFPSPETEPFELCADNKHPWKLSPYFGIFEEWAAKPSMQKLEISLGNFSPVYCMHQHIDLRLLFQNGQNRCRISSCVNCFGDKINAFSSAEL